jgi:hypothetical protein
MMNFLRKHMRKIFIITIVGFVGGIFMGGGAYLFGPVSDYDTAATVNGTKIPMKLFTSLYNSSVDMYRQTTKETPTDSQMEQIKTTTLQAIVQDELFFQQAQNYKILVSDAELKNDIQTSIMFKNNDKFDSRLYYSFLNLLRMSPKEYEAMRRKQLAGEKVKLIMASAIKLSDSEYEAAVADGTEISKMEFLQSKANTLLNDWYLNIARNSKIVTSEVIFK